jgi:hypothetical protein
MQQKATMQLIGNKNVKAGKTLILSPEDADVVLATTSDAERKRACSWTAFCENGYKT